MSRWLVVAALLTACRTPGDPAKGAVDDAGGGGDDTGASVDDVDADGDGWTVGDGDCDDADPDRYPGAPEVCDGVDNGCVDGWTVADEAGLATWTPDGGAPRDWTRRLQGTSTAPADGTLDADGTLRLCAGTWYATLAAEQVDVRIFGAGRDETAVSGGDLVRPLVVRGGAVEVGALTLRDGRAASGGCLSIGEEATVLLDTVRLDTCAAEQRGGGAYVVDSDLVFEDIEVFASSAAEGGGLALERGDAAGEGIAAVGNAATGDGAGVWVLDGELSVTGCAFDANTASGAGGAAYARDTPVEIASCAFTANTADSGGALHVRGGTLSLGQANLTGDQATGAGGAVFVEDTHVSLAFVDFADNTAGGDGGALYGRAGDLHVSNASFDGNATAASGGALAWSSGAVSLTDVSVTGGAAIDDGGGILATDADLSLLTTTIDGNTAGGVGGAVAVDTVVLQASSASLSDGAATDGGGVFATGSVVILDDVQLEGNVATSGGAALAVDADSALALSASTVADNTSADGAALWLHDATLAEVAFSGNAAVDVWSVPAAAAYSAAWVDAWTCDTAGCASD